MATGDNIDWSWGVSAAFVALFLWERWQAQRTKIAAATATSTSLRLNMASDRELMLATFRRELANYLVRLDPDRFLRLYQKSYRAEKAIIAADNELRLAEETVLTKRYPMYTDFDLIRTREHVLYADALETYSIEDIEEHFLNLVKFHALQCTLNPDWRFRSSATSDDDLEHLQKYINRIKDTKFKQRLHSAISEFETYANAKGLSRLEISDENEFIYETNVLAVRYVSHFAEIRTGFYFKDTGEYALYGKFFGDDLDKVHLSYFRSNDKFEAENFIDDLRIDEKI